MGLSSKLFLIAADDNVHALSNAAFMRMLRRESDTRIPEFAGQLVRQASIVIALERREPTTIVRCTFSILDIDQKGVLDVERWDAQQIALVADPFASERPVRGDIPQVIDAAHRFIARGGAWVPEQALLNRIEQAALQKLVCPRVKVVR
ncbi:MAG TPA: hypothetical protein DCY64_03770 [Hydrogenophaga sp.]|uniref:hypothetical protein n=1 Tax=Hydrogenophaga sp. TaxID=1904254 RepID=UPI0008B881FC|nr:hypothetical protein [Hydrogenophaga sp.]OGA75412.1 MAG: hypothetical protein A2X73_03390 [Burkholderiales bacterium GWE1_65_30]OGA93538.1 MAG: hypothetical protein A2X72_20960 [Burkholderiales bacterium GWF1_66_17]HAX19384.1 hypothetical protein [Hydrogenophaga sp.]HBU18706.1 hypothetical protein [Hydrogenophaga sp.]